MTLPGEVGIRKHCVAGAFMVALLHALTVAGATYQVAIISADFWNKEPRFFLVNYSLFLAPCVLAILVRKSCLVVALYSIPVSILFGMRMYNVWQCWWLGINSMARQKGDALAWVTMLFDALSGAVAVPWLLGMPLVYLYKLFMRQRPAG